LSTDQGDDDLAIRVGLERVWCFEVLPEHPVVVNLAIDGENEGVVFVRKRLGAAVYDRSVWAIVRIAWSSKYLPTPTMLNRS
jgi:hypothetical protein